MYIYLHLFFRKKRGSCPGASINVKNVSMDFKISFIKCMQYFCTIHYRFIEFCCEMLCQRFFLGIYVLSGIFYYSTGFAPA